MLIPNNGLHKVAGGIIPPSYPAELRVRSTIAKSGVLTYPATISPENGLYIAVEVQFPREGERGYKTSLAVGEYEYELTAGGQMLSSGLLQVGEYHRATRDGSASGVSFKQGK